MAVEPERRGRHRLALLLAAPALLLFHASLPAQDGPAVVPPRLVIQAPPGFEALAARVDAFDPKRLADVMRLVGLREPGRPIVVALVPETAAEARTHSREIAGYTLSLSSRIVLFPARSPVYPHDSLEDVLRHEVAHVLLARAARGRPIPRWFNEGVAMAAEHQWGFPDDTRLVLASFWQDPVPLGELDADFSGSPPRMRWAYAWSRALVHALLERDGPDSVAAILQRVAAGQRFDAAFTAVAGATPEAFAATVWQHTRDIGRWTSFLTSSLALWMGVTVLALYAFRRQRARRAASRARWDDEEGSST